MNQENLSAKPKSSGYRAYMLRAWEESSPVGAPYWRYSIETVASGKRKGFASLEALYAFLQKETELDLR